jgi:Ribbon-helix-helix protein, copG family
MRTTVTLDEDVAARLRAAARERDVSFKVALNDAVRAGLGGSGGARPYRVPVKMLEVQPGIDLDKALTLASELEDAELLREFELRK